MKVVKIATTTAVLVLLLFALIIGCGKDFTHNAPDGASITFNPSSLTYTAMGDIVHPVSIRVADSANKPMNGIKLVISGGFAYPYVPTHYFFYDSTDTTQYSSGFTGVTDAGGVYNFTIHIPASTTTSSGIVMTNAFTDQIEARSGTVFNDMEVKFNQ